MIRPFAAFFCLALLAACGGNPPDPRAQITPGLIQRSETPLMFAEIPDLAAGGRLVPMGSNGDVVTWRTTDRRSFSFESGVLISTRGLGFDLMSSDVSGTIAALAGAGGEYERFQSYLDGENQTQFRSFRCTMASPVPETIDIFGQSRATHRHDETCHALGLTVENVYWTADGTVWKARQWIGEQAGYLLTERLKL